MLESGITFKQTQGTLGIIHYPLQIVQLYWESWCNVVLLLLLSLFSFQWLQNSLEMGASWRILVSVLTVPFPREASSRMWGYEVFFPVAQLVLTAPLFILVMASQQKRSSREVLVLSLLLGRSSGTAPLSLLQLGQTFLCLDVMTFLSTSSSAALGWSSCWYFRLPEI